MTAYNSIKSSYDKLQQSQEDYGVSSKKYSLGFITKNELEKAKLDLDSKMSDFNSERNDFYLKDTKQNVKVKSGIVKSGILKKIFNKKVIAVICAIAVAGGGFTVYKVKTGAKKNTQSSRVRYTSLSKTNLYKMVSSSGAIKSGTSTSNYRYINFRR